jgi:hypothetical protein
MFNLVDIFAIDDAAKVRKTDGGFIVAMPRVARTGIQLYRGHEVGRKDMDIVRVFRSEDEVFKKASLATYGNKPVTDDHPPVPVTASNWKDYAKGALGEDVLRDQEFIRVPMCLMDQGTIDKFDGGKAELSVGYQCDIKWGAGTSPAGEAYDALQTDIAVNHVAVVKAARGGPALRIGDGTGDQRVDMTALSSAMSLILKGNIVKDSALADADAGHLGKDGKSYPILKDRSVSIGSLRAAKTNAIVKGDGDIIAAVDNLLALMDPPTAPAKKDAAAITETKTMKTLQVDGITCEMSDTAVEVVQRALKVLADANAELVKKKGETQAEFEAREKAAGDSIAKLTTEGATKDAQIATLTKQLADAAVTPAKLDALVADRKVVADKAKACMGDKASVLVIDGKSDNEIRAQVVKAKLGDAANGWSEDQVKVSFDTLTAGIDLSKITPASSHRPGGFQDQARMFSTAPQMTSDAEAAADRRDQRARDAWKGPAVTQ